MSTSALNHDLKFQGSPYMRRRAKSHAFCPISPETLQIRLLQIRQNQRIPVVLSVLYGRQAADEDVIGIQQTIAEVKHSVLVLEGMVSACGRADVIKVHSIVHQLRKGSVFPTGQNGLNASLYEQLEKAINALQRIYRTEMK